MKYQTKMKLHRRTQIYKGKTISLREDLLERPDGSFTRWSVVEHPGAVAMIPLDGSGNVILVDQFRYAAEENLLELPAGTCEENETPIETARRELREEIGMDTREITPFGGFFTAPGFTNEYIHLFVARNLFPAPNHEPDEDEDITVRVVSLDDLESLIESGEIRDAKTIAGLIKYKFFANQEH